MFGLSPEQNKFQLTNRCPNGHWVIPPFKTLAFFDGNGAPISPATPFPFMDRSAVAECPVGHEKWSVFASSERSESGLGQATITVIEMERTKEDYYVDHKIVDNSEYDRDLKKTLEISETWTQSYVVEAEKTRIFGGSIGISPLNFLDLELKAEQTLRDRYEVSEGQERTYTTTEEIPVAANAKVHIYLHWKREWQHGLITYKYPNGSKLEMPFKVAAGLDYDMRLVDE